MQVDAKHTCSFLVRPLIWPDDMIALTYLCISAFPGSVLVPLALGNSPAVPVQVSFVISDGLTSNLLSSP